jgi:KUP system potassium uptake protein
MAETHNAPQAESGELPASHEPEVQHGFWGLVLGSIGVVYGDIGTSPIYAFREALKAAGGEAAATPQTVLGILSLILWALTLVVSVKYAAVVLRADNSGEGGTLSLMALARQRVGGRPGVAILFFGMAGAALFFGDAMITPAISVLSAVEGLEVIQPSLAEFVLPITIVILITLFTAQRFGTGGVAAIFGPVTAVWFLALGVAGIVHIAHAPGVLAAINPYYAVHFLVAHSGVSLAVIGAVFLAVTGAEALYADLGHFGRKPIVFAWYVLVFPCLILNYFGQGAYVLNHSTATQNPFFDMQPAWALAPMVILATAATVIASQAVISGAYSLTKQAIQLNILPRLHIVHTSETRSGQIFLPQVNMALLVGVILLVLGFKSSGALASAYGVAVTGQMVVTDALLLFVMWRCWNWSLRGTLLMVVPLLVVDLTFLAANGLKIFEGAWVAIGIGCVMLLLMTTWLRGTKLLFEKMRKSEVPLELLTGKLEQKPPTIVPGTAVFLTGDPQSAPTALLHSLKHYKALHEQNVILHISTASQPKVENSERVRILKINPLFSVVVVNFGYMEEPNIPKALALCRKLGWKFDIMSTSFFLSRRSLKVSPHTGMPVWQDRIFIWMARNAADATEYFKIPTGRVVEIGAQVVI